MGQFFHDLTQPELPRSINPIPNLVRSDQPTESDRILGDETTDGSDGQMSITTPLIIISLATTLRLNLTKLSGPTINPTIGSDQI